MFWNIIILLAVSYWVSSSWGWPFKTVLIVLGVVWGLWALASHFRWFGGIIPPVPARTVGGSGGITGGAKKFVVGFSTLTFVMMVGTAVIGVSNNDAFRYFLWVGPRPWIYPISNTDALIWVSLFFLSVVIGACTANGRLKPALVIFGVTLVFLFTAREAPRVAEMARPKATTPMAVPSIPPPTTKWEEADQAAAESGTIPTAFCTGWQWAWGPSWPCGKGTIGGAISGMLPPARTSVTTSPPATSALAPPIVKKVGKQPILYQFSDYADKCVSQEIVVYDFHWYPKGGSVTVFPPKGRDSFVDTPGIDVTTHIEPGIWKWCSLDPGTTGIEIWQ